MQTGKLHRRSSQQEGKRSKQIRLLVADDQPLFTLGLRTIFTTQPDIYLLGTTSDGVDIVEQALQFQTDVVLMNLTLSGQNGIMAAKLIKQNRPKTKVVLMIPASANPIRLQVPKTGADFCCSKKITPENIVSVIRNVHNGDILAPDPVNQMKAPLTPREAEILLCLVQGLSNKQIGRNLDIALSTVKNHLTMIYHKLGVKGRTQASLLALIWGLTTLSNPAEILSTPDKESW